MYVMEYSDADAFLAEARHRGAVVSVLRTDIVAPMRQGQHVVMRPAILLKYSFHTKDNISGEVERVFEETTAEDRLENTLFAKLKNARVPVSRVVRSGSVGD